MKKLLYILLLFLPLFAQAQQMQNLRTGKIEVVPSPQADGYLNISGNLWEKDYNLFNGLGYGGGLPFDTTDLALWLPFNYDYINSSISGSDTLVNSWYDYYGNDSAYQYTLGSARPKWDIDSGIIIDGVDDYLESDFDFSGRTEFTINMTVYITGSNNVSSAMAQGNSVTNRVYITNFIDGNLYCVMANTSAAGVSVTSPGIGWHTITMRFDGSQLAQADRIDVWVNGVEPSKSVIGAIGTSCGTLTNKTRIGQYYAHSYQQGEGAFKDIQIFDKAISEERILKYHE